MRNLASADAAAAASALGPLASLRCEGPRPADVAVLTRTGRQLKLIEEALRAAAIPGASSCGVARFEP